MDYRTRGSTSKQLCATEKNICSKTLGFILGHNFRKCEIVGLHQDVLFMFDRKQLVP